MQKRFTDRETAKNVLTKKHQELITRIRKGDIESIRVLADELGHAESLGGLFEELGGKQCREPTHNSR